MRIAVTGASGLLGRAVVERCTSEGHQVLGLAKSRAVPPLISLDLLDTSSLREVLQRFKPNVIIHTAAERRPDVVEADPQGSWELNVDVPGSLAEIARDIAFELVPDSSMTHDAHSNTAGTEAETPTEGRGTESPLLIYISTDYVFDGTSPPYSPSDEPNPLNSYGRSKREGEKAVLSKGESGRVCIWRVPVLYGKAETHSESAVNCLLDVISPREESKGKVKMDAVAVRYPTSVEDVSRGVLSLSQIWYKSLSDVSASSEEASNAQSKNGIVRGRVPPILHFSAKEAMTKQDMCFVLSRVQRALGEPTSTDHLEPVYEVDPNDTSRPRHVKLDLDLTERCGVDTKCTGFEEWWTPYLTELAVVARARREEERLQREKEEAEERARKEEEERCRARQEEEERQKAKVEAEERERKEVEERRKREAEEEANRQAAELARKAAEETAKRREEELARRQAEDAAQQEAVTASPETPQFIEGEGVQASPPMQPQPQQPASAEKEANNSSAAGLASSSSSVRARSPISRLAEENHAHASDSKPASLRLLGSPNAPSFSSLRARPTPPATNISESGGNSPASANASVTRSQSTARNEDLEEDPLSLSSNAEHGALVQGSSQANIQDSNSASASGSGSSATHMQVSRDESYFPSLAVPRNDPGLDVRGQHAPSADADTKAPNDGDSDGYGQPSPRESSVQFSQEHHHVPPAEDGEAEQNRQAAQDAGSGVTPAHKQSWEVTSGKSAEAESTPVAPRPSFSIKVGDPQRKGDPVTAHIVYTVRTKTNHPAFRSEFSALRRYSDFRWLHAALVHNNPGVFIPPVPEKHKLGRFNPELVEARRYGLENCINKIANHRLLQEDEDLRLFLESVDFAADVRLRDIRKGPVPTPEQRTYFGWSNQMSAPKFHETDEWFGNQKNYLDHLETQLKNLVRAVSSVSQQRRDAASAISELSHALMMLSGSSLSRSLSTCFAGLGEVQRRSCELNDAQAEADMREMGAVLYEYERIVGSVRKAFATRIDVWQAWQKSEEEYRKVRSKHEKLAREGRSGGERMHMSLQDVADAESRSLGLKRDFDLVGLRCKDEMDRFDSEKVQEVRAAVESWIQGQIERQIELIGEWDQYCALLSRQSGTPRPNPLPAPVQAQQPSPNGTVTSAPAPVEGQSRPNPQSTLDGNAQAGSATQISTLVNGHSQPSVVVGAEGNIVEPLDGHDNGQAQPSAVSVTPVSGSSGDAGGNANGALQQATSSNEATQVKASGDTDMESGRKIDPSMGKPAPVTAGQTAAVPAPSTAGAEPVQGEVMIAPKAGQDAHVDNISAAGTAAGTREPSEKDARPDQATEVQASAATRTSEENTTASAAPNADSSVQPSRAPITTLGSPTQAPPSTMPEAFVAPRQHPQQSSAPPPMLRPVPGPARAEDLAAASEIAEAQGRQAAEEARLKREEREKREKVERESKAKEDKERAKKMREMKAKEKKNKQNLLGDLLG